MKGLTYDGDLFDAVAFGDRESVKMYWQDSIEINHPEKGGNTMLMIATFYGFEDMCKFFLSKRPNLSLVNDKGQTVKDIAIAEGHVNILEMLEEFSP